MSVGESSGNGPSCWAVPYASPSTFVTFTLLSHYNNVPFYSLTFPPSRTAQLRRPLFLLQYYRRNLKIEDLLHHPLSAVSIDGQFIPYPIQSMHQEYGHDMV